MNTTKKFIFGCYIFGLTIASDEFLFEGFEPLDETTVDTTILSSESRFTRSRGVFSGLISIVCKLLLVLSKSLHLTTDVFNSFEISGKTSIIS